jgi:putative peptidoglycan lipid II flippase
MRDAGSQAPVTDRSRALARAGSIVLAGYLLARGLGYVRVLVNGAVFGAGPELDAFYAAFRLPDLVLNLVATGALAAAVVPALAGLVDGRAAERAGRTASALLTWGGIAFAAFGLVLALGAPLLVPLLAPGFDAATRELAVSLTREMAPAPLLLGLGSLVSGVLNAHRRFGPAMIGPIAYNVVTVACALLLSGSLGIRALTVGVVVGSAAHLLIQLPALFGTGLRIRPSISLADPGLRRAVALLGPRALGLSTGQVQLIVVVALASTLPAGSVTAFTVAFTLFQVPAGLLGVPVGTVALPEMSDEHARGGSGPLGQLATSGLRLVLFLALPIAAIGVALAPEAVAVLFGYGRFDAGDVALAAAAARILFFSLAAESVTALAGRALYATDRTRAVIVAALADFATTAVLAALLVGPLGLDGLATAFVAGAFVEALILVERLRGAVPGLDRAAVGAAAVRSGLLAVGAGVAGWLIAGGVAALDAGPHGRVATAMAVAVATGTSLSAYVGASLLLRAPEIALVRRTFGRRRGAGTRGGNPPKVTGTHP